MYWIDKEGIYSSSNYKELIVDAIEVSKAVIFISSENSNASINVIREIGYAVNMNKPILPLMLDDAQSAKSIRLDMEVFVVIINNIRNKKIIYGIKNIRS